MPVVDLPDPKRPGQRQAVSRAALLGLGGNYENIADLTQALFEGKDPVGVVTVVVGNENADAITIHGYSTQRKSEKGKRLSLLSPFHFFRSYKNVLTARTHGRPRGPGIHRTLLPKTPAVTLTGVNRFEFCLLTGWNEMSVFLEIFNDLFADHFAFKTSKCGLDRFVTVY
jgi:hypothetical protein